MAEEWKNLVRSEPDTNAELEKHIEETSQVLFFR